MKITAIPARVTAHTVPVTFIVRPSVRGADRLVELKVPA